MIYFLLIDIGAKEEMTEDLHTAATSGDLEAIHAAIQQGVDINTEDQVSSKSALLLLNQRISRSTSTPLC